MTSSSQGCLSKSGIHNISDHQKVGMLMARTGDRVDSLVPVN